LIRNIDRRECGIVKIDMKIDLSYSAAEITRIQMTSQVDN